MSANITTDIKKFLRSFSDGINSVIESYGLTSELKKGYKTDWVPNMISIIRKQFSWARDEDMVYDMISDMYQLVFLKRVESVFSGYIPSTKSGHRAPLEAYLNKIMVRAAQEVSKKQWNHYKKLVDVTPMKDDTRSTDEDVLDRLIERHGPSGINNKEISVVDSITFDNLVEKLKNVIKNRKDYETQIRVLNLLINGYSPSEISRILKVSAPKISQRIKKLMEDTKKLAESEKKKGDGSLDKFLKKYELDRIKRGNRIGDRNQMENEDLNVVLHNVLV